MHAVAVRSVCSPHVVGDEDGEAPDEVEGDAERADEVERAALEVEEHRVGALVDEHHLRRGLGGVDRPQRRQRRQPAALLRCVAHGPKVRVDAHDVVEPVRDLVAPRQAPVHLQAHTDNACIAICCQVPQVSYSLITLRLMVDDDEHSCTRQIVTCSSLLTTTKDEGCTAQLAPTCNNKLGAAAHLNKNFNGGEAAYHLQSVMCLFS